MFVHMFNIYFLFTNKLKAGSTQEKGLQGIQLEKRNCQEGRLYFSPTSIEKWRINVVGATVRGILTVIYVFCFLK